MSSTTLSTTSGNILIEGGTLAGASTNQTAVSIATGSFTSGGGTIEIKGKASGSGDGIALAGPLTLSGTNVRLTGETDSPGATGVYLGAHGTTLTGTGALNISGSQTGTSGVGIMLDNASITRTENVSLTGLANTSADAGTLLQGSQARVDAGTAKVSITGRSSTGPGVKISGDLPPAPGPMPSVIGGDVSIDGNTSGSTALHLERTQVKASNGLSLVANGGSLLLQGSEISSSAGAGATTLSGASITLDRSSSVVSSQTANILLIADQMQLDGLVNAGASGTLTIRPKTLTRGITLAGTDEANQLNLTQSELNNLQGKVVQVGFGGASGGIQVLGPVSLGTSTAPATLSLGNKGSITQATGGSLQVATLMLNAASVDLREQNNVQSVSGKTSAGGFLFKSASDTGLQVGNVEANNYNGENTPSVWYPVEITVYMPGTSLTQAAGTLIEGGDILLQGAGAPGTATLGNVKATALTFNAWALVKLTGATQFDSIQFPGGSIQTVGGALNPGGFDRILTSAPINVGSMQIDPVTELQVDFDGTSHDKLVFPSTANVSFGSGTSIAMNQMSTVPDGTYSNAQVGRTKEKPLQTPVAGGLSGAYRIRTAR